jgi:hypothetical protein
MHQAGDDDMNQLTASLSLSFCAPRLRLFYRSRWLTHMQAADIPGDNT